MRYAIFGDVHANLEALQAVLAECERLEVDSYICIGDIVGYNASPHECLEIVRNLKPLVVIKGNHDEEASSNTPTTGFNRQATQAIEWTRTQLSEEERDWLRALPYKEMIRPFVTVVHATLDTPGEWGYIFDRYNAENSMSYQLTPICFYGHTHIPVTYEKRCEEPIYDPIIDIKPLGKYLINVGSVGQPRDGDWRASFVIYDSETKCVTRHRVEYDVHLCMKKVLEAGLSERLAERLLIGQ